MVSLVVRQLSLEGDLVLLASVVAPMASSLHAAGQKVAPQARGALT